MADIIVAIILILMVGFACFYIWKEKKKGRRCIGCSSAGCTCRGGSSSHSCCDGKTDSV